MKTKIYFIALIAVVVLLAFVLLFLTFTHKPQTQMNNLPTPTPPASTNKQSFPDSINVINPTEKAVLDHSYVVSQLVFKTPYSGNNFKLSYDFQNNVFTVTINQNNQQAGNTEFDQYLKQNGIDNRSWITNLLVVIAPFTTPTP